MNLLIKKRTALLLMLIMLSLAGFVATQQVYGATAPTATGKISEKDGVIIRGNYNTSSASIGSLGYNSSFTIKEEQYTSATSTAKSSIWYHMQSSRGNGYVRADLASISHGTSVTGETTGSVNVRTGAGIAYGKTTNLSKGTNVKVILKAVASNGDAWYKINYNGVSRYVSAKYVALGSISSSSDATFEAQLTAQGFPESYKVKLRVLHEENPNWTFTAKKLDYTWAQALEKQCSNVNANLIDTAKPESFKAIQSGTYNFTNNTYIGKDGAYWVAASKAAVAYYMDPRNWLTTDSVFMFEREVFDPIIHKEFMVKSILSNTAMSETASAYFMSAAKDYNVSPIFLASKCRVELGSSDFMINGHQFTYGGKTYQGFYNAYNIGASDSADGSAALKGLVYAAGGSDGTGKSYLRPWNTLEKAVKGGAAFISEGYISQNQYSTYYERFNVLNGLSNIGTHQYQTATFSAATQGQVTYDQYSSANMLELPFDFEIPVYQDMTSSASPRPPSKGNNNCFLDSIDVENLQSIESFAAGNVTGKDGVNIRKSYSNSSEVVATLEDKSKLEILEEKFTSATSTAKSSIWYKVQSTLGSGYIRSDMTSMDYGEPLKTVTTGTVNMRKGAGTSHSKIESIVKGATIEVVMKAVASNGTTWYKIKRNGTYGYVSSTYVSLGNALNQGSGKVTASGGANIRKSYTTSSAKAGFLNYNRNFSITEEKFTSPTSTAKTDKWYRMKSGTITGYVRSDLTSLTHGTTITGKTIGGVNVRKGAGTSFEKSAYLSKGTAVKIIMKAVASDGKPWYKINYKGVSRYVSAAYVSMDGNNLSSGSGETTGDDEINVRSSYSDGSAVVETLKSNSSVTIKAEKFTGSSSIDKSSKWYQIQSGSTDGYVRADLISIRHSSSLNGKTTGSVNLREGAGTPYKVAINLPKGTTVKVVLKAEATNGDAWYKINYDGSYYYAFASYIDVGENMSYSPTFNRFTSTYTLKTSVPSIVDKLTIATKKNISDAKVTITDNVLKYGENKITIKCTSSTGLSKYYYLKVTRDTQ